MKALIINYGVGNLFSLSTALKREDFEVHIGLTPRADYDLIVLPGVGSFNALKNYTKNYGDLLREVIESGVPTLGICLGMQFLYEFSTECNGCRGLGILSGYVDKLRTKRKLPHIGWDKVYLLKRDGVCELFTELDKEYVYFIHSYAAYPKTMDHICMVSLYDSIFPAAVGYRNVVATQFHVEKSGYVGKKFFKYLARWVRR